MNTVRDVTNIVSLKHNRVVLIALTFIILAGAATMLIHPARAAVVWSVSLDANNTSQLDVSTQTTGSLAKTFRVGAIVNASTTNPISGIFGWQVQINYDPTILVPVGDPSQTSSYPDGSGNAVLYGAQTTQGNWAGKISNGLAFGSSAIVSPGQIQVFLTLLGDVAPVTLSAPTLLASVSFELVSKPTNPQNLFASEIKFVDSTAQLLPNPIVPGTNATETITNNPPVARFTSTPVPAGDASCVPVTNAVCSTFAMSFNGSTSSDAEDGTIASPTGFFWDFGDATQDLATTGSVVVHDFGAAGTFTVTLRVIDSVGATGSARDGLGGAILNSQPSHTQQTFILVQILPLAVSVDCGSGQTAGKPFNCVVSATGGTAPYSGTGSFSVTEATKGTFTESFTVTDFASNTASGSASVTVAAQPLVVTVSCPSSGVTAGKPFQCTITANGGTSPYTGTDTFTLSEAAKGLKTETFSVTDANSVSASGAATVNVAAQPLVVTVSCPTSGVTVGKPLDCTVTAAGGTAPYTGIGSFSLTEVIKGTREESFTVTDANGASASGIASVVVAPQPLVVTATCPSSGVTAGKPFDCTVTASGGTAPYIGTGTISITVAVKGLVEESFTVTDANGASASASATVTVDPQPLIVVVTCPTSGVTAGKPFNCTVEATGGTAPYTGTGTQSITEAVKGSITESFSVTDANGVTASGSATVNVAPQPLVVTASCPASGVTAGKPFDCTVTASGGTAPYTGIGTISITVAVKGLVEESFTVTDANGASATAVASVDVSPQPLVVVVSCPDSANAGEAFDCTVTATGGTAPYTGTDTFHVTVPIKGVNIESFDVTDANSVTATGSAIVSIAGTPLVVTVYCPATADVGESFDCTVSATGDTAPYNGIGTFSVTEPTKGLKIETFSVTDANGVTASGSTTVDVFGTPLVVDASCPSTGVTTGKPFTCTVTATGGTAPYSGVGSITRIEPIKGLVEESFTVTDANGATTTVTATVDVAPQPLVVTVTCPASANVGEAFDCDISATGGTEPYTGTGTFSITEPLKGVSIESFSVTDANEATASGSATVSISGTPLVVDVTCPAIAAAGESFDCSVTASGGTGPYLGTGTFSLTEPTKGVKTESFTVIDANGVTDTGTATVTITGQPFVVTVVCPASAGVGEEFVCVVSATGGTAPYTGTGNIEITESSKGSKIESFTVTDANAASETVTITVIITPRPLTASFTVSANATVGKPVTFTATATGGTAPYTFTWDFGDGTTGTGSPVSHTFPTTGQIHWNVTLTVNDANGAGASSTRQIQLIVIPPPIARFTESATTAPTGTSISFDASGSTSNGTITTYSWNFGDGTSGSGVTTTHTYSTAGNYTVTLSVTDSNGLSGSATALKVITDRPPTAAFTFTPTSPLTGQSVSFDASSSSDPDGTIVIYSWSFGDSTTGSGVTTTHVYTSSGTFNITLIVTDNNGKTGSSIASITVTPAFFAGAHAALAKWSATSDIRHESLAKDPANIFFAYGVNDGNRTVWVYVRFHIVSDTGSSTNLYTQRVQLSPGQTINGKTDSRFSAQFIPPTTASFTVLATIYYSGNAAAPPISDTSFHPDLSSAKSFSFTVVP